RAGGLMRRIFGMLILGSLFASCAANDPVAAQSSALLAGSTSPPRGGTRFVPHRAALAQVAGAGNCARNVELHGNPGAVIGQAKITTVYWGSYWSGAGMNERTKYDQVWKDVGNNEAFYSRLAEYSTPTQPIQTGSWTGSVLANTALGSGTTVTEEQIQ